MPYMRAYRDLDAPTHRLRKTDIFETNEASADFLLSEGLAGTVLKSGALAAQADGRTRLPYVVFVSEEPTIDDIDRMARMAG